MSAGQLVTSPVNAKANIDRYEHELSGNPDLQSVMSMRGRGMAMSLPTALGGSHRASSLDIYNDAAEYVRTHRRSDGRRTERALAAWSEKAEPGSAAYEDMMAAVMRLFAEHGRTPNKLIRVSVLKPDRPSAERAVREAAKVDRGELGGRITVNAGICGGRPTICGMRIRVSDILDMLAAGASRDEILTDYPYLEDEDISASLAYAAQSADHRIVDAA